MAKIIEHVLSSEQLEEVHKYMRDYLIRIAKLPIEDVEKYGTIELEAMYDNWCEKIRTPDSYIDPFT